MSEVQINIPDKYTRYFKNALSPKVLIKHILLAGIASYLLYNLSLIGWREIYRALPREPIFYILSVCVVLAPIISDVLVFRVVTKGRYGSQTSLFIRKHVFNESLASYAGDAYVAQHLSRYPNLNLSRAMILIKDMALARTFVANLWLIIIFVIVCCLGHFGAVGKIASFSPQLLFFVGAMSVFICLGVSLFLKNLTRLSLQIFVRISGVHLARACFVSLALVTQWLIVLPEPGISIWFTFLLIYSLAKKSPVGGDLVFVSVALVLPGVRDHADEVAAMLIASAALYQLIYFFGYVLTSNNLQRLFMYINPDDPKLPISFKLPTPKT